ncbi:ABC transporter substrate-binding protein [Pseudomonas tolaasii]|uniref:ABC transporter substrate-binding protein n=2 Tax=Pseudomonas tolaasii TaxID=29442 RepID=A0A7Y8AN05_PSETO|nr:ABC transporter substrate-binding protein [Pseudomonas tolaasii]ARB30424.1 ABC transporter substrate-binding protein [Pseudomonas tolaasii]KAB0478433.1 ABC transporter substrate-binding protein [Pseudomonas tolaasii]MBW4793729.1 ABC transporter substrate-binding protein [Pseudomonas tolaasii]MBY8942532.1 ABC transporter substrate-binding protein [Pseudomonas tolaasii]NWC23384.1 ABC transporter substrate-binding protein [Pseudomonas tolaasii]
MKFAHLMSGTLLLLAANAAVAESTLRIGIQDDPDVLDPHRSRTYSSRLVYAALCDKLVDINPHLEYVPQLATAWHWSEDNKTLTMTLRDGVTFHDGEPFDAAAVKFNLDRARTLPDSLRKSELSSVDSVEVVDARTVAIRVKQPDATLISQLSDRAGMMLAPKASATEVGSRPICSGPYKFVQRVQQDRIVLERFDNYWNKQAYHFDKVIFLPIPDTSVRLANLRSGDLQMIERVAPTDVKTARADSKLQVFNTPGLGYMQLMYNTNNGERAKTPMGQDKRVRKAFELAIDRDAINQVVFEGLYAPGAQPFPMSSPYYDKSLPVPARDVEHSKKLLAEAGVTLPLAVELKVANNPIAQQVGQIIQAMAGEAGFKVNLVATEYATLLSEQQSGNFQVGMSAWSGRPDPDGDIYQFVACKGGQNDGHFCDPKLDALLDKARTVNDQAQRQALYFEALRLLADDVPASYLYFDPRIIAMRADISGFVPNPDGLIRLENVVIK